jgi:hypothetical protein
MLFSFALKYNIPLENFKKNQKDRRVNGQIGHRFRQIILFYWVGGGGGFVEEKQRKTTTKVTIMMSNTTLILKMDISDIKLLNLLIYRTQYTLPQTNTNTQIQKAAISVKSNIIRKFTELYE